MKDEHTATQQDISFFRDSMIDVRRIHTDKVLHNTPKPLPHPVQTLKDEANVLASLLDYPYDPTELQPGDSIVFSRPGLQKTIIRKLKKGHYRISAELDLHGMTVTMAEHALIAFFKHARSQGLQCIRIIHGKGHRSNNRGPVLKPFVNNWLRKREEVLAYSSARPVDGGTGALYVLLK